MLRYLIALWALLSLAAAADLKLSVTERSPGGAENVQTRFFQGARSRRDWRSAAGWRAKPNSDETFTYGPRMALIYQCDMHRVLELDLDHRQYTAHELDSNGLPQSWEAQVDTAPARRAGGRVHISYEVRDTGDRREMFGRTARRLVINIRQTAQPGACASSQRTVQEGWYIDFEEPPGECRAPQPKLSPVRHAVLVADNCDDQYSFDGPPLSTVGYPIDVKTTVIGEVRNRYGVRSETRTYTTRVTELSTEPLDPLLFELPTGFRHVDKLDDRPSPPLTIRARWMWENTKRTVKGWWPW